MHGVDPYLDDEVAADRKNRTANSADDDAHDFTAYPTVPVSRSRRRESAEFQPRPRRGAVSGEVWTRQGGAPCHHL